MSAPMPVDGPAISLGGQSVTEFLIGQTLSLAGPSEAAVLEAAAIPAILDAEILTALLGPAPATPDLLPNLARDYTFIGRTNGHYVYYESAREVIRSRLYREDPARFRELNLSAAVYCREKRGTESSAEQQATLVRSEMYHLLAAGGENETRGYRLLLDMYDRAELDHDTGVAFLLNRLAEEQRPYMAPEHRAGLDWLEARLKLLEGRLAKEGRPAKEVYESLDKIERSPGSELDADIEVTRTQAYVQDKNWAEAIKRGRTALQKFKQMEGAWDLTRLEPVRDSGHTVPLRPYGRVQALIALAQAYSGLAKSVRGSRTARGRARNDLLNFLWEFISLLERTPILVYLAVWVGPGRILPAVRTVARDQDWVVARLLVTAVRCLLDAEAGLQSVQKQHWDETGEILWAEVRRTRGLLYRTLGLPDSAVYQLSELIENSFVKDNEFRLAAVRFDLAESLLDAGQDELCIEELNGCLAVFQRLKDIRYQAHAHLVLGRALYSVGSDKPTRRAERLGEAVHELGASLALYRPLKDKAMVAEVMYALDRIVSDPAAQMDVAAHAEAMKLRETVEERQYPIRFEHPWLQRFRTGSAICLVLLFLLILFFSVRSGTGTEVGGTALLRSEPILGDHIPQVAIEVVGEELRPHFSTELAFSATAISLIGYLALYLFFGFVLISFASEEDLHKVDPHMFLLDHEAIHFCQSSGREDRSINWSVAQEKIEANRAFVERPLASFSHLVLYGGGRVREDNDLVPRASGIEIDVPGNTLDYGGAILSRIRSGLEGTPARQRSIGYALWGPAGFLFLLTLVGLGIFLVGSRLVPAFATDNRFGPYAFADLYPFSYLGLLLPLYWWFVVNPLWETFLLKPTRRWPLALGLVGLVLQALALVHSSSVAGTIPGPLGDLVRANSATIAKLLPQPVIYPALIGAALSAAAGCFVVWARLWKDHPSNRVGHVYALPLRAVAAFVTALTILLAFQSVSGEVLAYHAVVEGNDARDKADVMPGHPDPGWLAHAEQSYTRAVELSPGMAAAWASRGAVRAALAQTLGDDPAAQRTEYDLAIQDYTESLRWRPLAVVYGNRGTARQAVAEAYLAGISFGAQDIVLPDPVKQILNDGLEDLMQAQELDPQNSTYVVRQGMIWQRLGDYDKAMTAYDDALAINGADDGARAGQGWALFKLGMKLRETSPAEAQQKFMSAWSVFQTADQRLQERRAGLTTQREIDALDAQRGNVQNGLGWAADELKLYEVSTRFFEQAIQLDPKSQSYYVSLGSLYWLLSRPLADNQEKWGDYRGLMEKAIASFDKGIQYMDAAMPGNFTWRAYSHRTRGLLHYLLATHGADDYQGEMQKAIDDTQIALSLDEDAAYHGYLGTYYSELSKRPGLDSTTAALYEDRAAEQFTAANDQAGKTAAAERIILRGWNAHVKGDDAQAVAFTLRALQYDNQNLRGRFNLGLYYLYLHREDDARQAYAQGVTAGESATPDKALPRYKEAISDLNQFKKDEPWMGAVADELVALLQASAAR